MIKVILNGCGGKMGHMVISSSSQFDNIEVVAGVDNFFEPTNNFKVFKRVADIDIDYDVLLDFSRSDALGDLLSITEKTKKPLVLCSTGYSKEQLDLIEEKSKTLPLFKSANMSVGINLINSLLKKVAPLLYGNFDIEVVEKHHNQKIDSPSGTALLLADTIKDSLEDKVKYIYGREGDSKRESNEIGMHAIRGGSIVGDHDVIFAGNGEVIELTHKAISREVFAVGALKACEYMSNISKPGLYNMDDLIGF